MAVIDKVAEMIARERGHSRELCNDKCHCYRLAGEIVAVIEAAHAAERNRLAETLADRTDELLRMRRFMGDAA